MEDEDDEDDIEHARTLAAIHTTFDFYDADSSGSIDSSEFEKLVAELNGVVEMERESCLVEMEGKDGEGREGGETGGGEKGVSVEWSLTAEEVDAAMRLIGSEGRISRDEFVEWWYPSWLARVEMAQMEEDTDAAALASSADGESGEPAGKEVHT